MDETTRERAYNLKVSAHEIEATKRDLDRLADAMRAQYKSLSEDCQNSVAGTKVADQAATIEAVSMMLGECSQHLLTVRAEYNEALNARSILAGGVA